MKKKLVCATLLFFAFSSQADAIGGDCRFQLPRIDEVFVDFLAGETGEIRILGECLTSSVHPEPVVTLGFSEMPLNLALASETEVIVSLPLNISDGDYDLMLKRGPLARTHHDLTIGAVGPQGPPGEDGADGRDGVDGKDGVDGADGKDGVDGVDGKDGTSCSVTDTQEGAVINCTDSSSATITNGERGPQGPAGGISGYEIVERTVQADLAAGSRLSTLIQCPEGKQVLSGGFFIIATGVPCAQGACFAATQSQTLPNASDRWFFSVKNQGIEEGTLLLTVSGICAFTQ